MAAKGAGLGPGGGSPSRPTPTTPTTVVAGGSGGGALGTGAGTAGASTQGTPSDPLRYPNVDSLPCVHFLRAYCGRNVYTRSLLLMELARIEENEPAAR